MFLGCEDEKLNTLTVNPERIDFLAEGSTANFTIQTDASSWEISNSASDWLIMSAEKGNQKTALIALSVNTKTLLPRSDTLLVKAGNAKQVKVIVTQPSSEFVYQLSSSFSSLNFMRAGNMAYISISSTAPEWNISSDVDWLQFSQVSGNAGNTSIDITALENFGKEKRFANVQINADNAPAVQISVSQNGELYPSYNTSPKEEDATGMSSNASELATKIILGWNIGNSLEAIGSETAWGNPQITKALIDSVKKNGFNAVRIPCSWNQYMANNSTAQIKSDWLNRVQEVVQYCVDNDMYVLLNIHWDGGWLEKNCTQNKQEENNAKQKAFWEQIATHFRDFDEHLMFASANEPDVENATEMAVLKSYHQTFIDAVRSTGGKNSYRVLVVQGPATDIEKTNTLMTSLPTDNISNRMMVEIHFYTPWNFCGLEEDANWGNMFHYWGNGYHSLTDTDHNSTWGEESTVNSLFALMKSKFVDKGIPVLMGEYGAIRRSSLTGDALTQHLASRAYYLEFVTKQAKANGILPFYWDNGNVGNNGFAIFNRTNNTVFDQQALGALISGSK